MLDRAENVLDEQYVLDLSGHEFIDGNHLVNEHVNMTIQHHTIRIELNDSHPTYDIIFGKLHQNYQIAISGRNNNVIISDCDIDAYSLTLIARHAVIEEYCNINLTAIHLTTEKFDNYGHIETGVMESAFIGKKYGLCNDGSLTVRQQYTQTRGSCINFKYFKARKYLLEQGDIFCNKEKADWFVSEIQKINCASIYFDGYMMGCDMTQAVANYIYILPTVFLLAGCKHVILTALEVLKCDKGATLEVTSFIAQSKKIFIEGVINAIDHISLRGTEYILVRASGMLLAPNLYFRGLDVFVYGKLFGQMNFPDIVRHLYLSKQSEIAGLKFKALSYLTEAYGKLRVYDSYLNSELAVETGSSTEFKCGLTTMISNYVTLSGSLDIETFQLRAVQQLMMENELELKGELLTGNAGVTRLAGKLNTGVDLTAHNILNSANINNGSFAQLVATQGIINSCESSIHTAEAVLDVENGYMVDKGSVRCTQRADVRAKELHLIKGSITTAANSKLISESLYVGGKVDCSESLIGYSEKQTRYLSGNQLTSPKTEMQSGGTIDGSMNLCSTNSTIYAKRAANLLCGNLANKGKVTVATRSLLLDTSVDSHELVLVKLLDKGEQDNSELIIGPSAHLKARLYYEDFASADSYGMIDVNTGHQNSTKIIRIHSRSATNFSRYFVNKTTHFYFSGKLTSSYLDSNESGFFVYADTIRYADVTFIDSLLPIRNEGRLVHYAGVYNASALVTVADHATFESDCHITDRTWDVVVHGKSKNSTVEVASGASITSREFMARNLTLATIRGSVTANRIVMEKIEELLITMTGQLGSTQTKLELDIDRIVIQGRLEADDATIKSEGYYFVDGWNGRPRVRVNRANIITPHFYDLFSITEAQQITVSSYTIFIYSIWFANWSVKNAAIKSVICPQVYQPEFLLKTFKEIRILNIDVIGYLVTTIKEIKDGKVNALDGLLKTFSDIWEGIMNTDPQYLLYVVQLTLSVLDKFIPAVVSLALNITLSTVFLSANLKQLSKLYEKADFENLRDVDLIPLLVGSKNALYSMKNIGSNSILLAEEGGFQVRDKICDVIEYLGGDLGKDICDFFHIKHSDANKSHPSQNDPKPTEGKKEEEPKPPVPTSTVWEDIDRWWIDFRPLDALHDACMQYVFPVASLLAPYNFEDSIINIKLFSPILTGTSTERSLVQVSWGSRVFGMSRSMSGGAIFKFDDDSVETLAVSGNYVYLGTDISNPYCAVLNGDKIDQRPGTKIRTARGVQQQEHLQVLDFKASRSFTFVCNTPEKLHDFLKLSGKYKSYRPENQDKSHFVVTYDLNDQNFKFNHDQTWDWGVVFKGKSVDVAKGIYLNSKGEMLGFISTDGSVIALGDLASNKVILIQSANKAYFYKMNSKSKELYVIAYSDVDFIKCHNTFVEGSVVSQRQNVRVLGGTLEGSEFLSVVARRKVINTCDVRNSHHHGQKDKRYEPGIIKGGAGKFHNGVGLYVQADELELTASKIGAVGNAILNLNHDVYGAALHNSRLEHNSFSFKHGKFVSSQTVTEHIKRPTFYSELGKVFVISQRGVIRTLGALFDAPAGTMLISRMAPVFEEFIVRTTKKESSYLGTVLVSSKLHIKDEYTSAVITKTDLFGVVWKYGDCYAYDITFDVGLLLTQGDCGGFYIGNHNINVYDQTTSLTLSFKAGPVRVDYNFNPDVKHHTTVSVDDPLFDQIKHAKEVHDKGDAACTGINMADAAFGKLNAVAKGSYREAVDCTVGVNATYTNTTTVSQKPGRHWISVGRWIDTCRDGDHIIGGMSGNIGDYSTESNIFEADGATVSFVSESNSVTAGVAYNLVLQQPSVNGGVSHSASSGTTTVNSHVHIHNFVAWNRLEIRAHNANVTIDRAHGHITNVDVTSGYDAYESTGFSISGSTAGAVSGSYQHDKSHAVNSVSQVSFKEETDDCQIDHARLLNGSEVCGDGVKGIPADAIESTAAVNTAHNSGFSLSVNVKEKSFNQASLTNKTAVTKTGEPTRYHGTHVAINNPVNMFGFFNQNRYAVIPVEDREELPQVQIIDDEDEIVEAKHTVERIEPEKKQSGSSENQPSVQRKEQASVQDEEQPSTLNEEQLLDEDAGIIPFFARDKSGLAFHPLTSESNDSSFLDDVENKILFKMIAKALYLGPVPTVMSVTDDVVDVDAAWNQCKDDNYEPLVNEGSYVAAKWAVIGVSAKLVKPYLVRAAVYAGEALGVVGLGLIAPEVGTVIVVGGAAVSTTAGKVIAKNLVANGLFSARTLIHVTKHPIDFFNPRAPEPNAGPSSPFLRY